MSSLSGEKKAEERCRGATESRFRIEEADRLRHELGEGQAVVDEGMMNDMSRKRGLGGDRKGEDLEQSDRPSKKSRRSMDDKWGLEEETESVLTTKRWLLRSKAEIPTAGMVQSEIKTWTWLEMEARKLITDIADKIVKEGMERSQQREQEEGFIDTNLNEVTVALGLETQPPKGKEQAKIGDLWTKLISRQKEEQARRDRVSLRERKESSTS